MCIKLVYKLIYETIYILKDMSWKLLWLSGDTKNICQISIKKNITCNCPPKEKHDIQFGKSKSAVLFQDCASSIG